MQRGKTLQFVCSTSYFSESVKSLDTITAMNSSEAGDYEDFFSTELFVNRE